MYNPILKHGMDRIDRMLFQIIQLCMISLAYLYIMIRKCVRYEFRGVTHQSMTFGFGLRHIGSPDILCGNVTKFSIAKNGYAHRNLRTRISLELIFYVSSSLISVIFQVVLRVLCTARNVQSVSANLKTFC